MLGVEDRHRQADLGKSEPCGLESGGDPAGRLLLPVGVAAAREGDPDAVAALGIQSGDPDPARSLGEGCRGADEGEQRLGGVLSNDPVQQVCRIDKVRVNGNPAVQQRSMPLVQRHRLRELHEHFARGLADVPLHAEVAEHRGDGPERQLVGSAGGVRGGRADVAADQLWGQHRLGPALDGLAFQCVVAVGCPHPVGALEDAEIHPRAARGTALDFDPRMRGPQDVEQPVCGERLRVRRRQAVVAHLGEVAVLVPLQVGDVVLAQEHVEAVVDVLPGLGVDQIEHLLAAPQRRDADAGSADPARVRAHQVRILVDHLRLHPQAELHAPRSHRIDERCEAVRPHLLVHVPVAEAGRVVTAVPEPAIVKHEAFDPHLPGPLGQLGQDAEVVVEVHGLPGVQHHGSRRRRMPRPGPHPSVEGLGDAVDPVLGVRSIRPRGGIAFARAQSDLAGREQLAHPDRRTAARCLLQVDLVVAAEAEVCRPHPARAVRERRGPRREQHGGVVPGASVPGRPQPGALRDLPALRMLLPTPPAAEVEQLLGFGSERQDGRKLLHRVPGVAVVREGTARAEHPFVAEVQLDRHADPQLDVGEGDFVPGAVGDGAVGGTAAEGTVPDRHEARREAAALAVADQRGPAAPSARRLWEQRNALCCIIGGVRHRAAQPGGDVRFRPEVGAPVDNLRRLAGQVDSKRRSSAAEVDELAHSDDAPLMMHHSWERSAPRGSFRSASRAHPAASRRRSPGRRPR